MQLIMKLFALLLVTTSPSIAVDPSEDPDDPCQESGACPDSCDQCGVHCHGEDVSAAKCDQCITDNKCEECKKCELARFGGRPDALIDSGDESHEDAEPASDPSEDPCQESGACPDVCDRCGVHCHGEDVSAAKCDQCITDNKCEECKKCEVARGGEYEVAFVEDK